MNTEPKLNEIYSFRFAGTLMQAKMIDLNYKEDYYLLINERGIKYPVKKENLNKNLEEKCEI